LITNQTNIIGLDDEFDLRRNQYTDLSVLAREWYRNFDIFLYPLTVISLTLGFSHSAFTFAYESLVIKSTAAQTEVPPGALITLMQKGLEYVAIEENVLEVIILLLRE
jgi:hypothetical protein